MNPNIEKVLPTVVVHNTTKLHESCLKRFCVIPLTSKRTDTGNKQSMDCDAQKAYRCIFTPTCSLAGDRDP